MIQKEDEHPPAARTGSTGLPPSPAAAATGARADLHVHSKYSDRPSEWFLRRIGAPESFVEPMDVYRTARARGMQFITISDHNTIDGAREIAHLPGAFLSCEVTTYFPEDECKIHCLVLGITEAQFETIQVVRENIYDFRQYLLEQDIVYSVAHPLYRVNDRLTVEHLEKLILLFNRFEGVNGTRDRRACELVNTVLRHLTPDQVWEMAGRHGIDPIGPRPWVKSFTGGSDDHSGLYIGSAFTETPPAGSVPAFLDHIRDGRHEMGGQHGTSLLLAHCFYQIAYGYYRKRFLNGPGGGQGILGHLFSRVLAPSPPARPGFRGRVRRLAGNLLKLPRLRRLSDAERMLIADFAALRGKDAAEGQAAPGSGELGDQRTFQAACRISHTLAYSFLRRLESGVREARLIDSLQTFASLGPVALAIAPYLASFRTQHKDERFLEAVAESFPSASRLRRRSDRRAWITDTFDEINGVAITIRTLGAEARRLGMPLQVITSLPEPPESSCDLENFQPIGMFRLPEYPEQRLAFPPFLNILEYLERERFSELIISTPGPMGLVGLAAARLLNLRSAGIYHTDFPAYALHLTQDPALEQLAWRYMHWFYHQVDVVFVPSQAYRERLVANGFDSRRLRVLERGVDIERFTPEKRSESFWARHGLAGVKFLYVGRVSKEKNLDALLHAFEHLRARSANASLAIVGDGPYLAELRSRFAGPRLAFTGFLHGEDLAQAYASADVFVFPSMTDTFGNAVLEAQASGLPAIVSDQGGPADLVGRAGSGIIVDATDSRALAAAMERLLEHRDLRSELGRLALAMARESTWRNVLEDLSCEAPSQRCDARENFLRARRMPRRVPTGPLA